MNPNIFNIDFTVLVRWILAPARRTPIILAFLKALVSPVVYLYQIFLRNRTANLYRLDITGQVVKLEKLLNDRYDFIQRRILVHDAIWYLPVYLYQEAELKPKLLFQESENKPLILYTESEAGLLQDDFVVLVPSSIAFNQNEMKALLNIYKLGGTRYKIELI